MNHDPDHKPSRTQRKREAEDLQAVGERLLALPDAQLEQLPLPDALRDAVRSGRAISQRGALRRQRQYIGRLMRELETGTLQEALTALDRQAAADQACFHAAEAWRDRMMLEGRAALESFIDAHPHTDRQRLRQLVDASVAEARTGKPPSKRRELFREIRRVLEQTDRTHGPAT